MSGCGRATAPVPPVTKRVSTIAVDGNIVEASCGQCQLGLDGEGCSLAVRIGDTSYFVDGTGLDDHGDAHGDEGMCNCIRRAKVSGDVVDGRFVATQFELLPNDTDIPTTY
jgi:hypothetical protein